MVAAAEELERLYAAEQAKPPGERQPRVEFDYAAQAALAEDACASRPRIAPTHPRAAHAAPPQGQVRRGHPHSRG